MPAKTPFAGNIIDTPAACAVPFRPYCRGVVTRTRNVSEYMLALALCLVVVVVITTRVFIISQSATAPHLPHITDVIVTTLLQKWFLYKVCVYKNT